MFLDEGDQAARHHVRWEVSFEGAVADEEDQIMECGLIKVE